MTQVVPIKIVVHLYAHPGAEALLRSFEISAADIMGRYGGAIEHVIAPDPSLQSTEVPTEIHVVSFPDTRSFELYRDDPDLLRLAPLREQAIAKTEIFIGHDGVAYPQPSD
ncbi:MAG: hypothetical protein AAF493_23400 [Pseudomonadota bacterium]